MLQSISTNHTTPTVGRLVRALLLWTAATVVICLACSFLGQYALPRGDSWRVWEWPMWTSTVWRIRVIRLLAAATVGAGLSAAGVALQALLRNPLAEPYVLGLSSGAGVGVLLGGILANAAIFPAWAGAFALAAVGATVTAVVVFVVAQRHGQLDPYVLLLSGVIVNMFNGAICLVLLQFAQREHIIQFIGWGMGRIPEYLWFRPYLLLLSGVVVLGGWAGILFRGPAYNLLSLGDEVAASSGLATQRIRVETYILVVALTAAAVALAGPIGFVGLIVPHTCRLLVGPDHRRLTLVSGFAGAVFLMVADTSCRLLGDVFRVGEIPVGVVTAMIGGPFFLFLLRRRTAVGER